MILERIRPEYSHRLLTWLPLALRLGKAGRGDHPEIIEALRELFESPEARVLKFR